MAGKSNVREVLEAIGSSPDGMTDEKDAVALLDIHLARVQGCNDAQDLAELIDVRDGARRALNTTFKVRTQSVLARSHADPLVNALAPLERLIENLQKARQPNIKGPKPQPALQPAPKVAAPQGVAQGVEAKKIPVVEPVAQPVVQPVGGGGIAEQLKDPVVLKQKTEWVMKTADPRDPAQRADMVAVLKALGPGDDGPRKLVFQKIFKTTVSSGSRIYDMQAQPILNKQSGKMEQPEKYTKNAPIPRAAIETMADIMAQLPTAHMPKEWALIGQNADKNTRGSYNGEDGEDGAELNYSLIDTEEGFQQKYAEGGGCLPGDPLENAKAFDLLIRHECGHKAGKTLAAELTKLPYGGDWKIPATTEAVLDEVGTVFTEFVAAVQQQGAPEAKAIRAAVAESPFDAAGIAQALKLPPERIPADHLLLKLLKQGMSYQCGSAPVSVGGRMYVMGGPEMKWFSFSKAAWDKRLSLYQYATPDEWFAEFYAAANNGDASLRDAAKARYPDAWAWMKPKGCIVMEA